MAEQTLEAVVEAVVLLVQVVIACSPADRSTKKHVYLPYRGAIPFWFYLVSLI